MGNGLLFEGKNIEKGCQDTWVMKCQNSNRIYIKGAMVIKNVNYKEIIGITEKKIK